jgi:alkanesulfonate monooxygenase SsuD/methylene tetrahydromethanopterin reductase-like flavin-dependent oxidoreductase (luciferase family)
VGVVVPCPGRPVPPPDPPPAGDRRTADVGRRIALSAIGLKPVQPSGPPILLAATSGAGLDRIADRSDGWLPFGLPIEEVAAGWTRIRQRAAAQGRDPHHLQLVVRADPHRHNVRLGADRPAFTGTCGQVLDDLDRLRDLGADQVILDLHETARTIDELLDTALVLSAPRLAAAA